MASVSDHGRTVRGTSGFVGILTLSIGFYGLLSFALMRSIRIDAYEVNQTRSDLLAYWVSLLIAVLIGARLISQDRLQFKPLFRVFFLIFYAALVLTLTDPGQSLISFIISRYGVLTWFLLGIGVGGVFDALQNARSYRKTRLAKAAFLAVAATLSALMVQFALQYLELPKPTLSYQSVANSASIFLIMTVGAMEALWGTRKPVLLSVAYLFVGTIIVAAIVSMQSTSIAALWAGVLIVFFWGAFWNSRTFSKILLLAGLISGAAYFAQTAAFEGILNNTRFAVVSVNGANGTAEFTSLTSRFEILKSFADQFAVAPLTGNFQAEILSGAGTGNYVHSLPLSFLTHTGIIGTALFLSALILLLRKRLVYDPQIDPVERQFGRMMLVVLALGTVSTFMTWSVLWFMMGILCRRPAIILDRN